MTQDSFRVLFAATEAYPFAKVGGLADVASALPKSLARRGHRVTLLLPGYPCVGRGRPVRSMAIAMGDATEVVRFQEHDGLESVSVYGAHNETYFDRPSIYGYDDDDVRFLLFSKAVVAFAAARAERPDVIHVNDWELGFVPQYVRQGRHRLQLSHVPVIQTIHNLAYQGPFDPTREPLVGLKERFWGTPLARGIAWADVVSTVSHRYRDEILTPKYGNGLDGLLRARRDELWGILNGVDYEQFDPHHDSCLVSRFDASSVEHRQPNKLALQGRSGLREDASIPLLGMVARLVDQKGVSLLCDSLEEIVALGFQLVIVGLGEERYERALARASMRHPDAIAYHRTEAEELARLVYAGADLFLAPSSYEPCGLAPLIAMRYGSIPVVRRTGGLAESISDYQRDPSRGLGFTFVAKYPGALLRTLQEALAVLRQPQRWNELQRRAMAADFSWTRSVEEYEHMYRAARAGREKPRKIDRPRACVPLPRRPLPIAFVHHANQHLITDGYEDADGISEITDGYAEVLRLHERHGVPASLHLSGTLIEAAAWHRPEFLALVRTFLEEGLLSLVGGTYAENVMTLFRPAVNRRQLHELLFLYKRHLGSRAEDVKVCWVPERVWDTAALAPVLTDNRLPNGGYTHVLLDDRLLYAVDGRYPGSARAAFDTSGPYASDVGSYTTRASGEPKSPLLSQTCRPYRIASGGDLTVLPISAHTRYWIPPRSAEHWQLLDAAVRGLADADDDTLFLYADDLEKSAGVAGWEKAVSRYELFLEWIVDQPGRLAPVRLDEWLERHPAQEERELDAGTYFELAQAWGADEDYQRWWRSPAWVPYRRCLEHAEEAVEESDRRRDDRKLRALAWKHFLASTYETAWQDLPENDGDRAPAPWARAVASHARASLVVTAAAEWLANAERTSEVEVVDLDEDGEEEIVLRNEHLYAVLTPGHGARLVYLFERLGEGGVLSIGNPTDDWNLQEALNAHMRRPSNHPGALADVGFEDEPWRLFSAEAGPEGVYVDLVAAGRQSLLRGAHKRLFLPGSARALTVCYELTDGLALTVEACMSPDYYRLLGEGRGAVHTCGDRLSRGFRTGAAAAWLALDDSEGTTWEEPEIREVGHGLNLRVRTTSRHFHLLVGCGPTDDTQCRGLLDLGRSAIHRRIRSAASPSTTGAEVRARL